LALLRGDAAALLRNGFPVSLNLQKNSHFPDWKLANAQNVFWMGANKEKDRGL
jgi:hypothetical protein